MTTNKGCLNTAILFCIIILSITCNIGMNKKHQELFYHPLDSLTGFDVKARSSEIIEFDGQSILKLDGKIIFSEQIISDASIEVEILARESCYSGIVFRLADDMNYELAYAVPHVSGQAEIICHFKLDEEGNLTGTFDFPIQKANGMTLTNIKVEGKKISFGVHDPNISGDPLFEGMLDETGTKIKGKFFQFDMEGTFELKKKQQM